LIERWAHTNIAAAAAAAFHASGEGAKIVLAGVMGGCGQSIGASITPITH
jgi:hypothetical protein